MLSPHLNYHRPCLFASETVGEDGKARKVYRDRDAATPYEWLKAVDGAERFLKPGVSFEALDAEANAVGDLEPTRRVVRERDKLFRAIRGPAQAAAARAMIAASQPTSRLRLPRLAAARFRLI